MTPVEAWKISAGLHFKCLRRCLGNRRHRRNTRLAGKGIGIAGIDHHGPRRTALQALGAPVNRRRTGFREW